MKNFSPEKHTAAVYKCEKVREFTLVAKTDCNRPVTVSLNGAKWL